jgi:hypothetical protein
MCHAWGEDECMQDSGGKSWRKMPLGKPGRGCENKSEMGLRERGWDCMDWINLA